MKILFAIISLFALSKLSAQGFEELIKKGDSLYKLEKYVASADNFNKAFDIKHGNKNQYYNAACSLSLMGDSVTSIEYLCRSAERGWTNLKRLESDSNLNSLHSLMEWPDIIEMIRNNISNHSNADLQGKLEDIFTKDQTLRWLLTDAEQKLGKGSSKMKYYWSLIERQDSINEIEVLSILDKNGWLGIDVVGQNGNKALWLVIQHSSLEIQEKYLPLLRESVYDNKSDGSHLALLEDRILMRKGKPQIYGSQITIDKETGEKKIYLVKDPKFVNKRRRKVGLAPIETYLKTYNIEWENN